MPAGRAVPDERPHGSVPTLTEVLELKPPQGQLPGSAFEVASDVRPGPAVTELAAAPAPALAGFVAPAADAAQEPLACPAQAGAGQAGPALPTGTMADADLVVAQVLSELAPRIDMMFEARLREALAPALAQAADALIRDTRGGLSATLRELVQEAVVRALQRRAER